MASFSISIFVGCQFNVDGGYGTSPQVKWFMATARLFLAKGAIRRADKWAARVAPDAGQLVGGRGGVRVAEVAAGDGIRGILCAVSAPSGSTDYSMLLTNLGEEFGAVQLWRLYSERQRIEAFFKVGRNMYGMDNLRSRVFNAIHGFMWLVFIVHNLLQWVKGALFVDSVLAGIGPRELVEKLGRISARRERTATGWRRHLPAGDALVRLFVHILRPKWVQLSLCL